jgi:transcriptional regulator with XRE-family HTH domain
MKSENKCNEKPLVAAVRERLKQKNMTVKEAAEVLGISSIHLASLLNGIRRLSGLSQVKQERLADFLGMKKGEMFVLAGMLSPEDLLPNHFHDRVETALQHIQNDPEFRVFSLCEADIDTASDRVKLLLAVLYEKAITESLRAKAVSMDAKGETV